jgi:hypothetical protein
MDVQLVQPPGPVHDYRFTDQGAGRATDRFLADLRGGRQQEVNSRLGEAVETLQARGGQPSEQCPLAAPQQRGPQLLRCGQGTRLRHHYPVADLLPAPAGQTPAEYGRREIAKRLRGRHDAVAILQQLLQPIALGKVHVSSVAAQGGESYLESAAVDKPRRRVSSVDKSWVAGVH